MILKERSEFVVNGSIEYVINLLSKHHIKIIGPKQCEDGCRILVETKDKLKLEKILKDYGKKFTLKSTFGYGINFKHILRKFSFWIGIVMSIFAITFYSITITSITVSGCKLLDESTVRDVVLNSKKIPFIISTKDIGMIENEVLKMEGVSYVEVVKKGTNLEIEIVEELSKIGRIDTQNLISIKAKEDGVITKIIVYGGTGLVSVGDRVVAGQELIAPYLKNAQEGTKPTLAIGSVKAKVQRCVEVSYSNEGEFNKKFIKDYEEVTARFKQELTQDDEFLGSQFFVKNIDKSIVCSIYYDIITRIA